MWVCSGVLRKLAHEGRKAGVVSIRCVTGSLLTDAGCGGCPAPARSLILRPNIHAQDLGLHDIPFSRLQLRPPSRLGSPWSDQPGRFGARGRAGGARACARTIKRVDGQAASAERSKQVARLRFQFRPVGRLPCLGVAGQRAVRSPWTRSLETSSDVRRVLPSPREARPRQATRPTTFVRTSERGL